MPQAITLCIADDHKLFREGIKATLESGKRFRVVHEVENAARLKSALQEQCVDIVLLDYKMPGGGAMATIEYLKRRFEGIKIVMLTGISLGPVFQRFVELQVDGVLLKDMSSEALIDSIIRVAEGQRVIAEQVDAYLGSEQDQLSSREFQVMELVLAGLGNTEIASRMGIAVKTVGNHRHKFMQKLGLKNGVELMRYAIQNGLVDDE